MKNRKPPKQRCLVTKAMRESKIFAPKTIPNKKGKGVIYNRAKQDRSDLSGPFFVSVLASALSVFSRRIELRVIIACSLSIPNIHWSTKS